MKKEKSDIINLFSNLCLNVFNNEDDEIHEEILNLKELRSMLRDSLKKYRKKLLEEGMQKGKKKWIEKGTKDTKIEAARKCLN